METNETPTPYKSFASLAPPQSPIIKEESGSADPNSREKRKKTERRRPSNYGSNNRTERSRNDTNKNLGTSIT
jgi:hypothetical protein